MSMHINKEAAPKLRVNTKELEEVKRLVKAAAPKTQEQADGVLATVRVLGAKEDKCYADETEFLRPEIMKWVQPLGQNYLQRA